jgi:hypothetical protein
MSRRRFIRLAALALAAGAGLILGRRELLYWFEQRRIAGLRTIRPNSVAIIPRSAWDAREVNHSAPQELGFAGPENISGWLDYEGDLRSIYHSVAIHHSAYSQQRQQSMRSIQDLHMDNRGWADIGYHFGIDPAGQIYAGRDIAARGASVAGHNQGLIGVMLMGHFEWERPSLAALTALQSLLKQLAADYELTHLVGHGEVNAESVCPGRFLALYLDLLAQGAGLERGLGGDADGLKL